MPEEDEAPARPFSFARLPTILFGVAALLLILTFFLGWFSVDTQVQVWEYDPNDPEGKGEATIFVNNPVEINTEFKPLSLETEIKPDQLTVLLETSDEFSYPDYSEEAPAAGTEMLGVFFLQLVSLPALLGVAGFHFWNLKSPLNHGPTVWRFFALFGALSMVGIGTSIFIVPDAAETDIHRVLNDLYMTARRAQSEEVIPNFEGKAERMLTPEVEWWHRWICCPPDHETEGSVFPGADGELKMVYITTDSRPGAGFWFSSASLLLTSGGVFVALRARQLAPKGPRPETVGPPPPLPPLPPLPPKAV